MAFRGGVRARNRIGERHGRLLVVSRVPNAPSGDSRWECVCDCGGTAIVRGASLGRYTNSCGCLRIEKAAVPPKGHFKADISYRSAHTRIQLVRGRASDHACIDCGQPAEQWAYDGGAPDEMIQEGVRGGAGGVATLRYSGDPSYYSPRCRPCHYRLDRRPSSDEECPATHWGRRPSMSNAAARAYQQSTYDE